MAVQAAAALAGDGLPVRVVSMPCVEAFDAQDAAWKDSVLPPSITRRVAVEAGVRDGWHRFVGDQGSVLGLDQFGASAPGKQVYEHMGLTVEALKEAVRNLN